MRTQKELAVTLSRLKNFAQPKVKLEQYMTDSNIAAELLWTAHMRGELQNKVVADLGCGTGILGIGALLMGAKHVHFIDADKDALDICKENFSQWQWESDVASWYEGDITSFTDQVDIVLQNPPFGTKVEHADRHFLNHAFTLTDIVYSIHKTSTDQFVQSFARDGGFGIELKLDRDFPLPKQFDFHEKKRDYTEVSVYVLKRHNTTSKDQLRQMCKERRDALPSDVREEYAKQICSRLQALDVYKDADTVFVYASKDSEVPTHNLIKQLLEDDIRVVLPRMVGDTMELYSISSFEDNLETGRFGILEPKVGQEGVRETDIQHLSLALVPLLGFDTNMNRIGYGMGHFDRFLRKVRCPIIGLAYEEQHVEVVPQEQHDIPLNAIITEKELYT